MKVSRRSLLIAGSGLALGCGIDNSSLSPNIDAGLASAVTTGLHAVSGAPVAIGRDSGGIFAMSLICTHAGCASDLGSSNISCPCHGSVFDLSGRVLRGPAQSALPHLAVTVDAAGKLTIHGDQEVPASTRLAVSSA